MGKKEKGNQCIKCNHIFEDNLKSGRIPRCDKCYPIMVSANEKELADYIKSLVPKNITVFENKKGILPNHRMELDVYIPDFKLAFEYNGLYYHSEINGGKDKKYHLNKTIECEKLGIHLIHIFQDDWIYKNEIVKDRIKNILNIKNYDKIYARNCFIKEIDNDTKNNFLNKYHLQGSDKSKIKLGAFYNDELISVMTFGNQRIVTGNKIKCDTEFELIRFASAKNNIGLASKLLSCFLNTYKPTKIVSFADRCWTIEIVPNVYQKLGFVKTSNGTPNYWYFNKAHQRFHRFNFRKNILETKLNKINKKYDSNLTEWENMQLAGYDRIWDCGSFKYELNIIS